MGVLAETFNRMADTVRSTIDDLADERNKLSVLLDTMADGVVVISADGQVEQINAAARSLLQLREGAAGPAYLREPDLLEVVRLARDAGQRLQRDVDRLPGSRYASAVATPLEEGRALLTIHDLTGVRQLDVTRREFVSNVSHELRNPLAAISAIVETLEGGALEDPATARDFLTRMHAEVDGMSALVSDLLTLSRIESGREEVTHAEVDITALLRIACDRVKQRAEAAGVAIELDGGNDLLVIGEAGRLRQVVDNLLDNALRFTPRGGVVSIHGWTDGDRVDVRVADTGPGIAPEHLPHVFERFYKADPSRSDPGTGLGLAIAKHIVESHDGSIEVSSALGSGARFDISLPKASR